MNAIRRFVADGILRTNTLWGRDVMCPSSTGRFIADSWFSDQLLPPAYTAPAAAQVRAGGGVADKRADRQAVVEGVRSPLRHFSVGALIIEELFNIKNRRVAKAATLRDLLLRRCGST